MPGCCCMGYSGFFRCSAVRAALAPSPDEPGYAFGCAGLDRFASAKQRCPTGRAFITRPPPHPSHRIACEGPSARKTLRGPRRSKGYAYLASVGS